MMIVVIGVQWEHSLKYLSLDYPQWSDRIQLKTKDIDNRVNINLKLSSSLRKQGINLESLKGLE